MHGNNDVSINNAVFTAFKLMVDNLSHEEGSVVAVKVENYLKGKFPNAVGTGTENPVCERQASICPQENQIQRIMEKSNCFNLAVDLNNMIKAFNSIHSRFKMCDGNPLAKQFAKEMCKFGADINSEHVVTDSWGYEKPELSKRNIQWKAAIKILCEECIDSRFSDMSNTSLAIAEGGDSEGVDGKLNRFLDKLCQIRPDKSISINYLKYAIQKNYYDQRSEASLSRLVLKEFIGSGDAKIFADTLQSLLDFHDFVPENALAGITPQQASSIQAAAAAK
ncbi:hypothetical protein [Endozoicomonas sp. SCSIO W0465]|uniref:hypothetical protein n=1 Tax=Endozoicomonas sp. SCSIO W0465 TaxID=2918516 RepID=UPI0020758BEA|nr:hypothetical protein [Endozoicomonas sp. SCSIO W0465]USE34234.1 hypothetical protein MJO57_18975 [Endozoicomonas sp. SCSIO W0465]